MTENFRKPPNYVGQIRSNLNLKVILEVKNAKLLKSLYGTFVKVCDKFMTNFVML